MDLRLIEIVLSRTDDEAIRELVEEAESLEVWQEPALDGRRLVRIVTEAEHTEDILDRLERRFGHHEGFRVVITRVEATLPRPKSTKNTTVADPAKKISTRVGRRAERVSREELLSDLTPGMKISRRYLAMIVLSAIVAAVGLLENNVAVIIGAMVIAPLLTPNMALALATTLGDLDMMRRAVRTNIVGVVLALVFAVSLGLLLPEPPDAEVHLEIFARTDFYWTAAVVALAAGIAGALAFTAGVPASLVGVMVAVALMPPLVAGGLLIGSGDFRGAGGAFMLLAANVICVNLAGVATFLAQGVRPRTWWKADKALRASRRAMAIWAALLAALIALSLLMV